MGKSTLIAAFAVVALVLWMLSGQIGSDQSDTANTQSDTESQAADEKPAPTLKVQTRVSTAETITREIVLQGQLEPLKVVTLRAETAGNVRALMYDKGERIQQGADLARMSVDTRDADLAVAKANLSQANYEYEAIRKLQRQGLQSNMSLEAATATREAARAQLEAAEQEVASINISAPLNALIENIHVELGDFIERGASIATLVDNSQLLVTGRVPQQHVADIKKGQTATATLVTGQTLNGRVTYLASMADDTTRSFRVEILISNPPTGILSGISTRIAVPIETVSAHRVSPAVLALDDAGNLGVKALSQDNIVEFHPIEIIKTESNGAWVTGLPNSVTLITLGQGFVNPGEEVESISEESTSSSSSDQIPLEDRQGPVA